MLELTIRFVISDATSTDEALIAGLPHDLRAIADQVAQAWPGIGLNAALGQHGQLTRPAQLEFELAHGGRAWLEVRQRSTSTPPSVDPNADRPVRSPAQSTDGSLAEMLEAIAPPGSWAGLEEDPTLVEAIGRLEGLLARSGKTQTDLARRLLHALAGTFQGLQVKDRSGTWMQADAAPGVDPYYACAAFEHNGRLVRIPLPQLFPEAAAFRRSFSLPPTTAQLVALVERAAPEQLNVVRADGRALLERRRQVVSQGRYTK